MKVLPEWIDYNGHMNMAYYSVLFDKGADDFFPDLGLGESYAATTRHTTYTAEFHICYLRELHLGDRVTTTFQLINFDTKRFHIYQELWHEDGWLAATAECLGLHIDMSGPRVTPFPENILANLRRVKSEHDKRGLPERISRKIQIG